MWLHNLLALHGMAMPLSPQALNSILSPVNKTVSSDVKRQWSSNPLHSDYKSQHLHVANHTVMMVGTGSPNQKMNHTNTDGLASKTGLTESKQGELAWCTVRADAPERIAVMYWGTSSGVGATVPSIERNLYTPLRGRGGAFDVFVHFIDVAQISNIQHVGEADKTIPSAYREAQALQPCSFALTKPEDMDAEFQIAARVTEAREASKGILHDHNDFEATINVYRSRVSLMKVGALVRWHEEQAGFNYTLVTAVRPDTAILSPVHIVPSLSLAPRQIFIPSYAHGHSGYGANDRFAYGGHDAMLDGYRRQWEHQLESSVPVFKDSEHLLCQHLMSRGLEVAVTNFCLIRVRVGGKHVINDYIDKHGASNCTNARPAAAPQPVLPNPCPEASVGSLVESLRSRSLDRRDPVTTTDTPEADSRSPPSAQLAANPMICFPYASSASMAQHSPVFELPLRLKDPDYFTTTTHRGGWRNVMTGLLNAGIVEAPHAGNDGATWFIDCVEHFFLFNRNMTAVTEPWVGVVHYTGDAPWELYEERESVQALLASPNFMLSLKHCVGLLTLSSSLRDVMMRLGAFANMSITALLHPMDILPRTIAQWDYKGFTEKWQKRRRVLQVGQQYRKMTTIYSLNTSCEREWFPGVDLTLQALNESGFQWVGKKLQLEAAYINRQVSGSINHDVLELLNHFGDNLLQDRKGWQVGNISTDVLTRRVGKDEYDHELRTTAVVVPLWSASANNAVLELVASLTPSFITRLPATEEYLGPDYPMFYESEDWVSGVLENTTQLLNLMNETTFYLRSMPKDHLTQAHFQHSLRQVATGARPACAPVPFDRDRWENAQGAEVRVKSSPSAQRPFFFFHIPKMGGSSVRSLLNEDAKKLEQPIFAPCFGGVSCAWWDEEVQGRHGKKCLWGDGIKDHAMACLHENETACSALLAGHFGTLLLEDIAEVQSSSSKLPSCARPGWEACGDPLQCIDCLVVLRNPLDRLIAAYTEFDDRAMDIPFESLSEDLLTRIAMQYGNVTKAYLGNGKYDPQDLKTKSQLPPRGGDMSRAKAALRHCSIGIFERWADSQRLWTTEMPWSSLGSSDTHIQTSKSAHVTAYDLSEAQRAVLQSLLADDVELYDFGSKLFQQRFTSLTGSS